MAKVRKKDEMLARALLRTHYHAINFPRDEIDKRVDACWPEKLDRARIINLMMNYHKDDVLDGNTDMADHRRLSLSSGGSHE